MKTEEKYRKLFLQAGSFSLWLDKTRNALATRTGTEVPCGECRACCTSSYFIHIEPNEAQTLAKIPKELLFKAPHLLKGHWVLGYDTDGHCPMFIDNACSIYDSRPRTCRDYDCRIFPATGLSPGNDKPLIAHQANRWRFDFTTEMDHMHFTALSAAVQFMQEHAGSFPAGFIPSNTTQQAGMAIKVYDIFLDEDDVYKKMHPPGSIDELIRAIITRCDEFEQRSDHGK